MKRFLKNKKLSVKIIFSYLILISLTFTLLYPIFFKLSQKYFISLEGLEIASQANKIRSLIKEPLIQNDLVELAHLVKTLSFTYESQIWLIDRQGNTIASSENSENNTHKLKIDEINSVLSGNIVTQQISGPESRSLTYIVPVIGNEDLFETNYKLYNEQILGAVAINVPLGKLNIIMTNIVRFCLYAIIISAPLAILAGIIMSKIISRPFEKMNQVALEISRGNFHKRVDFEDGGEIGQLANTFNFAISKVVESLKEKETLVKLRNEFISNVSHEFRSPLTSLRGFLELIKDKKLNPQEETQYINIMLEDTCHLNRLVDDLLYLSSLQSGQIELKLSRFDTTQLLSWVENHYSFLASEKDIALEVIKSKHPTELYADRDRLHQVFINLLDNAFRYTPKGNNIKVFSRLTEKENKIVFYIQDTGKGIPQDQLEFIWERFYKVDPARTRNDNGTGIGLSIVKQIVEMHSGEVFVNSSPGDGTIFGFSLPLNKAKLHSR
ncbi:MAG: hypothetical protein CVU87_08415 [Firmicutes bacterium HGW-Firmicutes-12]|nr:MAG: hypothetical protein CVU87_08415 [Firmicutes bacterium HGW-Firmicutes-12]